MKYLALIVLFVLSSAKVNFALQAEDLLQRGNSLYQNGQYEKAIYTYEQILKMGYAGKNLYYNLGNAYFKAGRIGYAILNYEKALKLSPNDDDIIYNLKIANARTVDKIEVMPKLFFVRWWDSLLNMLTVNGWTVLIFVVYLILLITIGAYFFANRAFLQKWTLLTGGFVLVLFIFSVLMLALKLNYDNNRKSGVIVEAATTAKLSPDNKSGDAFIIHEGLKVDLEDNVQNWVKIRLADGKVGWVPESDLRNI